MSLCKPRKLSANSPPPLIWRRGFKRKFTKKKKKSTVYSFFSPLRRNQLRIAETSWKAGNVQNSCRSPKVPRVIAAAGAAAEMQAGQKRPSLDQDRVKTFFFFLFFNFSFSFSRSFDDQKEPCRPLLRFGGWTLGGDTSSWSAGAAGATALLRLWCWNRKNKDIQKWNSVSRYNLKAFAVEINCALSGVRLYLWGLWSVSWPRLAPQSRNTKLWWRTWNTNGKNSVFSGCHCCL